MHHVSSIHVRAKCVKSKHLFSRTSRRKPARSRDVVASARSNFQCRSRAKVGLTAVRRPLHAPERGIGKGKHGRSSDDAFDPSERNTRGTEHKERAGEERKTDEREKIEKRERESDSHLTARHSSKHSLNVTGEHGQKGLPVGGQCRSIVAVYDSGQVF